MLVVVAAEAAAAATTSKGVGVVDFLLKIVDLGDLGWTRKGKNSGVEESEIGAREHSSHAHT